MQARESSHPRFSEPYELEAGEEAVIDDLLLERPARVFVTLSVPPDLATALEPHRAFSFRSLSAPLVCRTVFAA